jgi:hypothetical protein
VLRVTNEPRLAGLHRVSSDVLRTVFMENPRSRARWRMHRRPCGPWGRRLVVGGCGHFEHTGGAGGCKGIVRERRQIARGGGDAAKKGIGYWASGTGKSRTGPLRETWVSCAVEPEGIHVSRRGLVLLLGSVRRCWPGLGPSDGSGRGLIWSR